MKYIIGNGISGLIWKYYNPEFQIIAPSAAGGMYAKTYLTWMHDCYETRKLITDLGWTDVEKRIKISPIGYCQSGWISNSLNAEMNLSMIQKKMTEWNKPIDKNFVPKTRDLSLSTGGLMGVNYMKTIDVDLEEVVRRISKDANVQHGFVTKITPTTIQVKNDPKEETFTELEYDTLVSTIPAPFFWKSWGEDREFRQLPITNIITNVKPKMFDDKYEMIYYNEDYPYSRISFLNGKYAIEFTGIISREEFQDRFPDLTILDYFVVPQGRIFEVDNGPPTDKIIFSGRFAQWKYKITTEFIISQALNYKNNVKNKDSIDARELKGFSCN